MSVQHKDWYTSTDVGVRIENSNGPVVTSDEVAVEITGTQAHKSFKSLTDALEEKVDVGAAVTSVEYDGTAKKIVAYKGTTPTDVVTVSTIKTDLLLAKGDVGLGNVDNTSDTDKPISTAAQTALNAKVAQTEFDGHVNDTDNPHQVTASQLGLGNVNNTADVDKDVNSAIKDGDGNVITETYETIAQAGASHTTLQGNIDAVSAIVQNLTGLEGTNFGGFSLDAVEATAISNIATIYTNAGYTSGDLYWFLAGTDMSVLKAYKYDGTGSPTAISSTVYDFTDFSGILTKLANYKGTVSDLDALHNSTDIGIYFYSSGDKNGLVSVGYSTTDGIVTQHWLSDGVPDASDVTIFTAGPALLMRTYSNSTWSAWQNPIAKNAADIAALGPKIDKIEGNLTTYTQMGTDAALSSLHAYMNTVNKFNAATNANYWFYMYLCEAGKSYRVVKTGQPEAVTRMLIKLTSTSQFAVGETITSNQILLTGGSADGNHDYKFEEDTYIAIFAPRYITIEEGSVVDVQGMATSINTLNAGFSTIQEGFSDIQGDFEELSDGVDNLNDSQAFINKQLGIQGITEFSLVSYPARSDGSTGSSGWYRGYEVSLDGLYPNYKYIYFRGADFTSSGIVVRGIILTESNEVESYVPFKATKQNGWQALPITANSKKLRATYCVDSNGGEVWSPSYAVAQVLESSFLDALNNVENVLPIISNLPENLSAVINGLPDNTPALPSQVHAVLGERLLLFKNAIVGDANSLSLGAAGGRDFKRCLCFIPSSVGNVTLTARINDITKTTTIKVVNPTNPSSKKNVLIVGASTTANYQTQFEELYRRLVLTSGDENETIFGNSVRNTHNPKGLGLTNIAFVGRKSNGQHFNYEATGGYGWDNYYGTSSYYNYAFIVADASQFDAGAVYTDGTHNFTITEISVSDGRISMRCATSGVTLSASGTLTKSSGSGASSLAYTSYSETLIRPFLNPSNNETSLQYYMQTYCNGENVDIIVFNGLIFNSGYNFGLLTNYAKPLIRIIHEEYPNAVVIVCTGALSDTRGSGLSNHYNSTSVQGRTTDANRKVREYVALVDAMCEEMNDELGSNVCVPLDLALQVDADYDYPYIEDSVNNRSTLTEVRGTNGNHPTNVGILNHIDAIYRSICYVIATYFN